MIRLKDPDVEPPDSSQWTAAIPINPVDRNCSQCRAVILLCPCRSHVAQLLHPVLICMHDAQQLGRKVDRLCKSACSRDLVFVRRGDRSPRYLSPTTESIWKPDKLRLAEGAVAGQCRCRRNGKDQGCGTHGAGPCDAQGASREILLTTLLFYYYFI